MTPHQIASENALTDLPDRIVVAPAHGRLALHASTAFTSEGEVVRQGDVVAIVEAGPRIVEVQAPCDAWILTYLARDGQRVRPGVPIVHLRAV